jgi:hypothetical protein
MKDELFESLLSKNAAESSGLAGEFCCLSPHRSPNLQRFVNDAGYDLEKARVVYRLFHGALLHHPHTLLRGLPFFRFTLFRLQPP